jgi:hypothetical protein
MKPLWNIKMTTENLSFIFCYNTGLLQDISTDRSGLCRSVKYFWIIYCRVWNGTCGIEFENFTKLWLIKGVAGCSHLRDVKRTAHFCIVPMLWKYAAFYLRFMCVFVSHIRTPLLPTLCQRAPTVTKKVRGTRDLRVSRLSASTQLRKSVSRSKCWNIKFV